MILLYAPKITNRIKYTASLLLESLCNLDISFTDNSSEYLNHKGPRINYSQTPLFSEEIFIYSQGLLAKKGVKNFKPKVSKINGLPVIFAGLSNHCHFGFDIFAASFYFVSRYEEYLPYKKDVHGRFEVHNSLAFRNNFIEIPVVNHYAILISEALNKAFKIKAKANNFEFIPTYDIDIAYKYKGKGLVRNTGGFLKDLLTLKFSLLRERLSVLTGKAKDPFDTYSFQIDTQKKHGLKPVYFHLASDYGPYDKNIYVYSKAFESLVKKTRDYATTGIHPSYDSFNNETRLKKEIKRFSKIANQPISHSRQHFIKLQIPNSYRMLTNNNILHDYSMGFATHVGFRAGICSPYYFYDLEREQIINLKIYPFAVMDTTLNRYMKLSPSEATKKINKLINTVKSVNGTFISVWHNDSLSETAPWKGWKKVYVSLIKKATS